MARAYTCNIVNKLCRTGMPQKLLRSACAPPLRLSGIIYANGIKPIVYSTFVIDCVYIWITFRNICKTRAPLEIWRIVIRKLIDRDNSAFDRLAELFLWKQKKKTKPFFYNFLTTATVVCLTPVTRTWSSKYVSVKMKTNVFAEKGFRFYCY